MRLNKIALIILFTLFTISPGQTPGLMTCTMIDKDPYTKEIIISCIVPKKDFIYKDFITFSVDDPTILLSPWKANKPSIAHYDSSFKEAKQIFNEDFTVSMIAKITSYTPETAHLYCSYYRKSEKKINHILFPLYFKKTEQTTEEPYTSIETIEHHTATLKPIKKESSFDYYTALSVSIIQTIITSLRIDHKKYFAFLIFIIMVLLSFFYFFKKELETQIILKEWIEIIISLLIGVSAAYIMIYFQRLTTPFTTMLIACLTVLYAGIFYIKKSTKVSSKNLRTLCTFMGMLCMSSILLLAFKALQYADQQFGLF